jgi:hypothetical protein
MPPSDAAWQQKLVALRAYVAAHGRLPPQRDASDLGAWINSQRRAKRAADAGRRCNQGTMTPARAAALEGVPGWTWDARRRRAAPAAPRPPSAKRSRRQ